MPARPPIIHQLISRLAHALVPLLRAPPRGMHANLGAWKLRGTSIRENTGPVIGRVENHGVGAIALEADLLLDANVGAGGVAEALVGVALLLVRPITAVVFEITEG